jgi:hypothetical protein
MAGRLAGQPDTGLVDGVNLGLEAEPLEPEAVGAEGVGLNQLRPGEQVLLVDGADEVRVREIELVVAAVDEHTAVVEDGAHGSVGEDRLVAEELVQAVGGWGLHGQFSETYLTVIHGDIDGDVVRTFTGALTWALCGHCVGVDLDIDVDLDVDLDMDMHIAADVDASWILIAEGRRIGTWPGPLAI